MDPPVQAVGGLRIDRGGMQNQAPERRLNMATRAAKPVIKVKMTERGIKIVAPQEADDPAAEPDAFGIAGRSVQDPLGLGEFIDFLGLFGGVLARRGLLLGGFGVIRLGKGGRRREWQGNGHKAGCNIQSAGNAKHTM